MVAGNSKIIYGGKLLYLPDINNFNKKYSLNEKGCKLLKKGF